MNCELTSAAAALPRPLVLVNGCFDILHPGHIGMLCWAKAQGVTLVVAVNGDESVGRIKGAHRPYQPLDWRMTILANLAVVNFVVPFDDDTPRRVIELLGPDIIVKGHEYADCRDLPELADYRGRILYAPQFTSISTSAFVAKITGSAVTNAIRRDRQETLGAVLT